MIRHDTPACRKSYGLRASGDATTAAENAASGPSAAPLPRRGHDVVIQPVTHIQGLGRAERGYLDHFLEEPRIGLGDPPVIRGRDHVGGQAEATQDAARADRLVPGDADPPAVITEAGQRGPDIGVEVLFPEPLRFAVIGPLLARLIQVESGPEKLERLPVVLAARDDRAEDGREHVTRDTQPVGPCPVLPRLIDKAFAHVENHRTDHEDTLRQHGTADSRLRLGPSHQGVGLAAETWLPLNYL